MNVMKLLDEEFHCRVYSDEVRENFKKPCFFVTATSVMTPQTLNWMKKELTIVLTYYADDKNKNEVHYLDVVDRVQDLFPVGISAGKRYLKIDTIEDDRAGEEDDILQITITIPYVESVPKAASTAEIMGELSLSVTHDGGRNAKEIFTGNIDKDTL
ncbi:phage tail terminator family protein [Mitsuokella jalaludinii]|uniref:phage tail terminator family protein n=1 Tax=Mitsuokella jalaludinii TaxID=187979 RepID=UPI003A914446